MTARRLCHHSRLASSSSIVIIILLAFLVQGARPTAIAHNPSWPAKVQPILQKVIEPGQLANVRVIVQQTAQNNDVAEAIIRSGGAVVDELPILNALIATVPAAAVPHIAGLQSVRWMSLDMPVVSSNGLESDKDKDKEEEEEDDDDDDEGPYGNTYLDTMRVRQVWNMGLDGSGIGVAVIDSGVDNHDNHFSSIAARESFSVNSHNKLDMYGHGTHLAGIIAGNGSASDGLYTGIAPGANLISLKVSDDLGMAYESDTILAMEWVLEHKDEYNIRVVNLSINSTMAGSYHASPLNAAVEILWFNGIVVVASSGNVVEEQTFNPVYAAPANDPFIISVGAADERRSGWRADDQVTDFSASGATLDDISKPDMIAPGLNIVSALSKKSPWASEHLERVDLNGKYFRLSGTSMAAPMVAAAVALLLQAEPELTPDQVKYRLIHTSPKITDAKGDEYPYLDVYGAVMGATTESANTGLPASQLLFTGDRPLNWTSVNWNSVNWNSVNWNSVNWNSVNWNSVNWNSSTEEESVDGAVNWNRSGDTPSELSNTDRPAETAITDIVMAYPIFWEATEEVPAPVGAQMGERLFLPSVIR